MILLRRQVMRLVVLFNREPSTILAVAAAIGLATGVAVIVFYRAIDFVQRLVLQGTTESSPLPLVLIPLIVAMGLTISRLLVYYGAKDSDGENIADVMRAVATRSGRIRAAPVAAKTLASAVVIGTGGSIGPEGPVVVAGAAAGATQLGYRSRSLRARWDGRAGRRLGACTADRRDDGV